MGILGAIFAVLTIIAELIAMINLRKILVFFGLMEEEEQKDVKFTPTVLLKTIFLIFIPLLAFITIIFYFTSHV